MPVTTKTFRDQNRLHVIFAASSILLALSVLVAVFEDWHNEYRQPQVQVVHWETEMTRWKKSVSDLHARLANVEALKEQLARVEEVVRSNPDYIRHGEEIADLTIKRDQLNKHLQLFVDGNISPKVQRVERLEALIQANDGTPAHAEELRRERAALEDLLRQKREGDDQVKAWEARMEELKAARRDLEREITDLQAQIKAINADLDKAIDRLEQLEPGLAGSIGNWLRNQPLLDAFNPGIKVRQQKVDDVLTDVNLAQVPTIDRCMTCHVTIDNPSFAEEALLRFLEFQVLRDRLPRTRPDDVLEVVKANLPPVALPAFWERAIEALPSDDGGPQRELREAQNALISAWASMYESAPADDAVRSAWTPASGAGGTISTIDDVRSLADVVFARWPQSWRTWYEPLAEYRVRLGEIVESRLSKAQRRALLDAYRHALVAEYNQRSAAQGRARLNPSRLFLAHPRLDLYADPDSRHPIARMGCTSCHEGSGEETQFVHTAHTPQNIWVDERTGMLIPDFLVRSVGSDAEITRQLRSPLGNTRSVKGEPAPDAGSAIVLASLTETEPAARFAGEDGSASHGGSEMFHDAHWYANVEKYDDPFGFPNEAHGVTAAAYVDARSGELNRAVKQQRLWEKRYGWHPIEFHYWERPMHELQYVESSCNRCHIDELQIDRSAPLLTQGRLLFTELGCSNCHAVDSLGSTLRGQPGLPDVRQIGPSLVHVKEKLSEDMIASWTWAPKAFRPNTRMPHFFLAENNSSPLDIRRTRAEVAAMAHYLVNAPEDASKPAYTPEPLPAPDTAGLNLAGSVEAGRSLFKAVGCLACHSNVNESGLDWVTFDLQDRFGLDREGALRRIAADAAANEGLSGAETSEDNVGFFALDASGRPTPRIKAQQYTRLHWHLMTHQPQRYSKVAPELSAVGTKLLHGRSRDQARAWLYDWLRNPTHYSDYTIMPRFRLSEQEALDLAAYLLEQKHPAYEPQHFDADEQMIDALLINLQRNAISDKAARERLASMTLEEKQFDLGSRMIQHYGCFGCHQISGFDSALAVSANLTAYGRKDPHKLDFGFFEHIFDHQRPPQTDVWFVQREGLTEDAVKVGGDAHDPLVSKRSLAWEHVPNDRRGYLYAKLHNSRIFDRSKLNVEGEMTAEGEIIYTSRRDGARRLVKREGRYLDLATGQDSGLSDADVEIRSVGEPYLKLRMPRFFLRDSEARALVAYVTSLKPPLVRGTLRNTADDLATMRAKGRLMAEALNCFGCHDIENNVPNVRQYFEVRRRDGSIDVLQTAERLPDAPPRLVGNGAKTQHAWFYSFLNNVEMLRPWLDIRMPSFNLTPQETQWLVEYLAGQTTMDARMIDMHLRAVDAALADEYQKRYRERYDAAIAEGGTGKTADDLARAAATLAVGEMLMPEAFEQTRSEMVRTAREFALYAPAQFPGRNDSPEDFAFKHGRIWYDLRFLREVYQGVDYPFQAPPVDDMTPEEFALGEALVKDELKCFVCHRLGDWDKLERIFEIQQEDLMKGMDEVPDEEDPYGGGEEADPYGEGEEQDPYGGDDEADPYGGAAEEDPYGAAPSAEPKKPSLYDDISAPNLSLTYRRLQEDYVKAWMRKPQSIMPGTKMPSLFGDDGTVSAFAGWPEAERRKKELLYGSDPEAQIDLIVRWLFAAGQRRYTVDEHLLGTAPSSAPAVNLDALLEQRRLEAEARGEAPVPEEPVKEESPAGETGQPAQGEEAAAAPAAPRTLTPEEQAADRDAAVGEAMTNADASTGSIVGLTLFEGQPPRRNRIRLDANCQAVARQRGLPAPLASDIVVNANGTLADVVVFVRNAPAGKNPLDGPKLIDQVGCIYHPHVTTITTGQTLSLRNSDPLNHNLNLAAQKNPTFNAAQPMQGMVETRRFGTAEMGMRLKCDIHAWMNALIYAFDHPYHAASDDRGVFRIAGLPPGQYEVVFHHPLLGESTQQVSVEAGKPSRADATFRR